jgi:hypothetical protein
MKEGVMMIEYHIELSYLDNGKAVHKTVSFKTEIKRNEIYRTICTKFADRQVTVEYLREHSGIQVSSYNYKETKSPLTIAQFVPTAYFKEEVITDVLAILESKALI